MREITKEIIESGGYKVLTAEDGVEGLRLFKQHKNIKLVITDVMMPKMGGMELAEKIRELSSAIRIIFVSGYAENQLSNDEEIPSSTMFLAKPISVKELLLSIRDVLDRKRC